MHWKLRRDPYLAPLVEREGEGAAIDAGFFWDEDPEDAPLDDVDWLCTPLPRRPVTGARPAVLLSTGGFCPVHAGHLAMMESAREAAVAAGFDVIAGYLSPGHDDYLRMKCGDAAIPASVRIEQCAAAVKPSGWMLVDPWEALHRRVSVNYTDVTARLRAYLRAHVDPRVEVLYVAGGDNARFALAFTHDGGCVVVQRPGAEGELTRWRERLAGHPRILWARGDSPLASKRLRAPLWRAPSRGRLLVRLEDARIVATLGLPGVAGVAGVGGFQAELLALLRRHVDVRTVPLRVPEEGRDVISLDSMLPATHTLAVSRLFALGGNHELGHVARPGSPPLAEQAAAIPPGRYVLRDDDTFTGGTLRAARALLPPGVVIEETRLAIVHDEGEEVADSRDFLLGADEGGLVVALPGDRVGRAPYLLPYVDPSARCGLPPEAAHPFSRAVWELNARTFARTGLRVRDLPAPARATFEGVAGTGSERTLEEVCRWHAERLRGG
jgi:nicotinic acid mononucleotide adenylyltransferase